MLELHDITKIYPAGGADVMALKGVSLQFRASEFVSILGPSGCGKTTMLNIIGGLDQYTAGDLVINGKSTKEYRDRDWDAYRNHSIGFVFQSYNLIPHQSVLQNVELALTLSGVSKGERRRRARAALEEVGLGDQLRKRPGEMSGGQMQRVAIARAIVNDPDIILADEPTGALDTETSIQVMDILKNIARDRLVIMVTHNPDLAERYSTRIVRMLDGRITDDSAPLTEEELAREQAVDREKTAEGRRVKKPSMSFATSFVLSLKNLITKKGRTALTSFAGSIGIIGIALIYAVSHGMTDYIDTVQEETLSSYPLTIEASHIDAASLLSAFIGRAQSTSEHENDAVYQKAMIYEMMNALNSLEEQKNDLKAFRTYIEEQRADETSPLHAALSGVQYSYDTDLLIYTRNVDGEILRSDTRTIMSEIMREYMGMRGTAAANVRSQSSFGAGAMMDASALWQELVPGDNGRPVNAVTERQYELIYGTWPSRYDEVVLFLDQNNELNDLTLYAMGLKTDAELDALLTAARDKVTVDYEEQSWSYAEICDMEFRMILRADCYTYDGNEDAYTDLRESTTGLKYLYDNGLPLHVTGIVRPNEDAIAARENGGIGYTAGLTEYIIEQAKQSAAVQAQQADPRTDIFTGLPFRDTEGSLDTEKKAADFRAYLDGLDSEGKAAAYVRIRSVPDAALVARTVEQTLSSMSRADMEDTLAEGMTAQTGMDEADIRDYTGSMSEEDLRELFAQLVEERFRAQYAAGAEEQLSAMTREELAGALTLETAGYTDEQCAALYDEVLEFSDSSYEENLSILGCVDPDSPSAINLYAAAFADKDVIEEAIASYNETVDELQEIRYTDYVGLMMSSITTIINAITYVLIAFVAVSLVVSSIMIGVITLISVQERTKEIGILRAIGASKKNVSSMFNAETVIIGFTAGLLGVLITYLLCIPINMLLRHLTGIGNLGAFLPPGTAAVLVLISMLLTLFAGIIPSRSAAKKDPVVALRTE